MHDGAADVAPQAAGERLQLGGGFASRFECQHERQRRPSLPGPRGAQRYERRPVRPVRIVDEHGRRLLIGYGVKE